MINAPHRISLPWLVLASFLTLTTQCTDDDTSNSDITPPADENPPPDSPPNDPAPDENPGDPSPDSCAIPTGDELVGRLEGAQPQNLAPIPDDFQDGFSIIEGPVWVDGRLLLSEINANAAPAPARILSYTPGENVLTVVLDGTGSNGLELDPAGLLVAARHSDGTISYLDITDGATQPIVEEFEGNRFNSPNDLTFHSNGTLYFTDPDYQAPDPIPQAAERAYQVVDGQPPEAIEAASVVTKPNGVVLSLDETSLYIGGSNGLYRFELDGDGNILSESGEKMAAVAEGGVDGITVDCSGNIYVTNGTQVRVLGANEQELVSIEFPLQPTNVEIGGPNGLSLFVTTLETNGNKPALFSVDLSGN